MNQPEIFDQVKSKYAGYEKKRRRVIALSNEALNHSKRAIFAMHRDDLKEAASQLENAEEKFVVCEAFFDNYPKLAYEGAHRAALEEYAEAQLFFGYVKDGVFGAVHERARRPDVYLAGLCDMTGEVVRLATREATEGNYEVVERAIAAVETVAVFLLELDLRGHVRNKADQAKRNLRKLEDMRYEIHLRET